MAKSIVMTSVSYTCDCCGCTCKTPAAALRGIHSKPDANFRVKTVSIDFCENCFSEFERWMSETRAAHSQQ